MQQADEMAAEAAAKAEAKAAADAITAKKDAALMDELKEKSAAVVALLGAKSFEAALAAALADPPNATKSNEVKAYAADVTMKVINSVKTGEEAELVGALDDEQQDTLMKMLYTLLERGTDCSKLLKWHGTLTKSAGLGCIVRALTDRKTVMVTPENKY